MARIIVFDVKETLLNVRFLEPLFEQIFGDKTALKEWSGLLLLHSEVAMLASIAGVMRRLLSFSMPPKREPPACRYTSRLCAGLLASFRLRRPRAPRAYYGG